MSHTLLVPIHLDALCLSEEKQAVSAMADYTKLPYIFDDNTHLGNQKKINLGEEVQTELFELGLPTTQVNKTTHRRE